MPDETKDGAAGKSLYKSKTIQVMVFIGAATPVIWPLLPPSFQDPRYSHAAICLAAIVLRLVSDEKIILPGGKP